MRPVRRLAVLVVVPFLVACSSVAAPKVPTERPPEREKEEVRTARVQRGDISGVLNLTGEIRSQGQQTVTARVTGRLERVHLDVGSTVQEGQPLAELDRTAFELRVAQAEAALATAEARLAGMMAGARPDEREQAEAVLRSARARLQALEGAPRGDAPEQLLANLQDARQRVTELEAGQLQGQGQADAAVNAARSRLDALVREPADRQNQATIESARQALRQAEEAAARARRPSDELSRARAEVETLRDQLILSRTAVSQADLEAARAAVQAAEIGLRRAGAPPSELELRAAQAEAQRAQAELEVARIEAREATITAPLTGMISEVVAAVGALVAPGTPLLTIIPPSFEVVIPLPEAQIGQVAAGQPVRIGIDAYPNQEFTGAIKAIAPAIDPRTRSVALRVEVVDPGFKLKSGMFAQLAVASPSRRGTLLVPREAVVNRSGEQNVFQVIDGRARRQPVQTGANDGRSTEILAGLADGAEVVLSSFAQADGAVVR